MVYFIGYPKKRSGKPKVYKVGGIMGNWHCLSRSITKKHDFMEGAFATKFQVRRRLAQKGFPKSMYPKNVL